MSGLFSFDRNGNLKSGKECQPEPGIEKGTQRGLVQLPETCVCGYLLRTGTMAMPIPLMMRAQHILDAAVSEEKVAPYPRRLTKQCSVRSIGERLLSIPTDLPGGIVSTTTFEVLPRETIVPQA